MPTPERTPVVFFGSGAFGLPTLAALARQHSLLAVVTQPDKPAGRGGTLTPTPVAAWAAQEAPTVPLLKPEKCNTPGVVATIRAFPAAVWVVIAFGQKLGPALLADRFAVNLHASLLPRWRGAAPIHSAVLAGDAETGNSVITLAEKMDAGLILAQSRREILPTQTTGELHDLLSQDGPALVLRVLAEHDAGTLKPVAQEASGVTLAKKLSRADGLVDPAGLTAEELRRRMHGLNPWPGVTVLLRGKELKLRRGEAADVAAKAVQPGAFIDAARGVVACAGGTALRLLEVQPAGGKPQAWETFARGARLTDEDRLERAS
jgi:methionyl-tRNA formyltransferase